MRVSLLLAALVTLAACTNTIHSAPPADVPADTPAVLDVLPDTSPDVPPILGDTLDLIPDPDVPDVVPEPDLTDVVLDGPGPDVADVVPDLPPLEPLAPYQPTAFVGTDGRWFRDDQGRVLLLRGANVSNQSKHPPYFPEWISTDDVQEMKRRGLNCVRFLVIWEAIEPEEGVFDPAYLDLVEERVAWFTDQGLYVLVDMHQDLYGSKYANGDGAPVWATIDHDLPYDPPPGGWHLGYGEPAVNQAFDSLYQNEEGVRDHYVMAWQAVAERFAGNPMVVGYDLMNEPWFGTWPPTDPKGFEAEVLAPFYEVVIAGIREVDPDHLIFVEPTTTKGLGAIGGLPDFDDDRVAYAPHYYHPFIDIMGEYSDSQEIMALAFAQIQADADAMGAPVLLGEWGFHVGAPGALDHAVHILENLEAFRFGATAWGWDRGGHGLALMAPDGIPKWSLELLTSLYPERTNGRLDAWHYDRPARTLTVTYDTTGVEGGETVLVVPSMKMPHGLELSCAPEGVPCEGTWDPDAGRLAVPGGEETFGGLVTLTVAPAARHPAPVPAVSTHIPKAATPAQEQELSLEAAAGIQQIRTDVKWTTIEPTEGDLHPEIYDALVDNATAQGIDFLALLDYSNPWAESEPGVTDTLDPTKFAAFAAAVAAHFTGRVSQYEIWNEENTERFWKPAPNPQKYGALLVATADAIHAVDPDAEVIFGGLAPNNQMITATWPFMFDVFEAHPTAVARIDAVAVHPYTLAQALPPEQEIPPGNYVAMLEQVRGVLGRFGVEHMPIHLTELGWPACPCPPFEPPTIYPNASLEDQARWLVRAYVLSAMVGVESFYWYDFEDGAGNSDIFSEDWFGLTSHDADGSDDVAPVPKPSYFAYQAVLAAVAGMDYAADHSLSNDCHLHRFTDGDADAWVAWAPFAPCALSAPADVDVQDMYGEDIGAFEAGESMDLTASPIYLKEL